MSSSNSKDKDLSNKKTREAAREGVEPLAKVFGAEADDDARKGEASEKAVIRSAS